MAGTLKLEIVTPETTAYSEDVEMVTLPGSEGELGVYPNHVPLLTTLNPGELRVLKGGKESFLAIGEGSDTLPRWGMRRQGPVHSPIAPARATAVSRRTRRFALPRAKRPVWCLNSRSLPAASPSAAA